MCEIRMCVCCIVEGMGDHRAHVPLRFWLGEGIMGVGSARLLF
jgi:hypothetical protein